MDNYITHLHAENVGVFNKLDISFNKGFNFIVGPNSCGKTSILKCIALALDPHNAQYFRYGTDSLAWYDSVYGDKKHRIGVNKGWVNNSEQYQSARFNPMAPMPNPTGVDRSLSYYEIRQENLNISPLFLGAYRRIQYKRIDGMHREASVADSRETYRSQSMTSICGGFLPDIKQWMINRYFEIDKDWATTYKNNWGWIIEHLKSLCPANCAMQFKEIQRELEPIFSVNGIDCYLEEISAGFQSILSLVFAIVEWIEATNEEANAYIPEATGTVIIDELDVHLHPEWQLTIRDSLKTIFPKLQFIVTTHSPHLISTAEAGELIILPELQREINVIPTARKFSGWNTDEILEEIMGVKSLENKEYAILINRALDCVEKKNTADLKTALHDLEQVVHPSNTILQIIKTKLATLELGDDDD